MASRETTINSDYYISELEELREVIKRERCGKLSKGILLQHDNARPHVSYQTKEAIRRLGFECLPHPPYSPDLAPSANWLFGEMKRPLRGKRFSDFNEKKIALERTKIFHQSELQTSPIKSFHEDGIARVNTELKSIWTPIEPKMVSFECDSNKMLAELNNLGKLVEKVRSGIDYKSKRQPLVSVCEKGKGINQLYKPRGVTVDNKTGNIYVSDVEDHCVKVFELLVSICSNLETMKVKERCTYH